LFETAKELVVNKQKGSTAYLQRRLKIGYARAVDLLDALEDAGVVGPEKGTKHREVLWTSLEEYERGSDDPLFEQAKEMVVSKQKVSATFLQRRLKVGFARAANLLDALEEAGVVGPARGVKGRAVLWPSSEEHKRGSEDPLFEQAKEVVVNKQKGSATYLQRRLKVGFARASNLLEDLEEAGVVGPEQGTKPREVLQTSVEEDV
jgi:DNA segregation ATPase FtsK/SpoIIIE-like protein